MNNIIEPRSSTLDDKLSKLNSLEDLIKSTLNWNWLDENWEVIEEIRIFNTYIRVLLTLNNKELLEKIEIFIEEKDKEKILGFLINLKKFINNIIKMQKLKEYRML